MNLLNFSELKHTAPTLSPLLVTCVSKGFSCKKPENASPPKIPP